MVRINYLFQAGSAGSHLAAETTLYIRDSLHAIDKVKGVNLISGCFDLSHTPSSRMATDSTLIISKKGLEEILEQVFHAWRKEQLQNPQYSPLYADLRNLPPALFTIGTTDPLIDDTYFMEARWRLAGNKTFLAFLLCILKVRILLICFLQKWLWLQTKKCING